MVLLYHIWSVLSMDFAFNIQKHDARGIVAAYRCYLLFIGCASENGNRRTLPAVQSVEKTKNGAWGDSPTKGVRGRSPRKITPPPLGEGLGWGRLQGY